MKKFYVQACAFFLCALGLFGGMQEASAQAYLSVQGTVQKSTGAAVDDGDYTLIFKLYTTETGGTPVWSETQDPVNIIGGVYSVTLGTVNPLTAAFDQPYYLGVTVGSGAELTPRARLTSSPYALSLIGQDNIFPSTGAVGVGTAAPAAGNELHVKNATAAAQVLVEGATTSKVVVQSTDGAAIELKKGANSASITYDGTNINVENLNLSSFSPATLAVTSKLAVGQSSVDANNVLKVAGRSLFTSMIEVNGSLSDFSGVHKGAYCDYGHCGTNSVAIATSIRASNAIVAQGGLWSTSDARIKKDIQTVNNASDLSLLRKLRVTKYGFIDEIGKGTRGTNGFIAQEVMGLFPEAISLSSDFIPNIYQRTQAIKKQAGLLTVSLENEHKLVVGDQIKLILPDDAQQVFEVKNTPSTRSFTIEWEQDVPETIFVYGKKVNDFHTVDYDRIFTLNVSATQELARRVEQLEAENAALRQRNEGLQKQNDELRTDVNDIFKRLRDLETKPSSSDLKK